MEIRIPGRTKIGTANIRATIPWPKKPHVPTTKMTVIAPPAPPAPPIAASAMSKKAALYTLTKKATMNAAKDTPLALRWPFRHIIAMYKNSKSALGLGAGSAYDALRKF